MTTRQLQSHPMRVKGGRIICHQLVSIRGGLGGSAMHEYLPVSNTIAVLSLTPSN
jgi:hypothetical protein